MLRRAIRKLRRSEEIEDLYKIIVFYNETLLFAAATIAELEQAALLSQRMCCDLAIACRVSLEDPDVDIRDDLDQIIADLRDNISAIEEQVVL